MQKRRMSLDLSTGGRPKRNHHVAEAWSWAIGLGSRREIGQEFDYEFEPPSWIA